MLTHHSATGPFVFLISTYSGGSPPDSARWFCRWLQEAVDDCRIQKSLLLNVRYSVFGLGNSLYGDNYNLVSQLVIKLSWLLLIGSQKPV